MDPQEHIVIVGAGTFGLSTALELVRKGHKALTVVDPYPVPSPLSAGNDVNKIVQSTVEDQFYSKLALDALEKWRKDPVYKDAFHEVGIVYGGTGPEALEEIAYRCKELEKSGMDIVKLDTPEDFAKVVKTYNPENSDCFKGWKGYHQKTHCGWTFARLALEKASEECLKMGAKFVCDKVEKLVYDEDNVCIGVKTYSGQVIKAKKTIICAGASSIHLLDFKGQLLAKCWTVGHIRVTDEEAKALKDLPVILNLDEGFLFEPDANNELKFCNEFPGYINMDELAKTSVPSYRNEIPKEAKDHMRHFLRQVLPEAIATREFCVSKICWCTDTVDRHFLFGEHPEHKNLILGTGDSGKGFKYMPVVGEYLSEMALKGDDAIPEEKREAWKWRPEQAIDRDIHALQQRMGGLNIIKDLKDVDEWCD